MASAGAMCNHVNHVSTQLPYAGTVGIICFVNYILAGFIQNVYICLAIGVVLVIAALFVIRAITARLRGRRLKDAVTDHCKRRLRTSEAAFFRPFATAQKGLTFDRECGIVNLPVSREVPFLCPFGPYREAITSRQGRNQ